jgi:hypothetical protein
MKSRLKTISEDDHTYEALMFICPGCATDEASGLHMLPVNSSETTQPSWEWDGNLEAPTLNPSILTGKGSEVICHSFLKAGVFEFLTECTHEFAGQSIPMPDLPEWAETMD